MKKFRSLKGNFLAISFFLVALMHESNAQITEGTLVYNSRVEKLKDFDDLDDETKLALDEFSDARLIMFFDEDILGNMLLSGSGQYHSREMIDIKQSLMYRYFYEYNETLDSALTTFSIDNLSDIPEKNYWQYGFQTNLEMETSDEEFIINGYSCKKYIVPYFNRTYFVTKDIPIQVNSHFSAVLNQGIIIKVEILTPYTKNELYLDTIYSGILHKDWTSTDTVGMINIKDIDISIFSEGTLGSGRNLDKLKCLNDSNAISLFNMSNIIEYNSDVDIPALIPQLSQGEGLENISQKEFITNLRNCGIMSSFLEESYVELFLPSQEDIHHLKYFLITQSLSEMLQAYENRKQLFDNMSSCGLIKKTVSEEIKQNFLNAEIDFSEFLRNTEFINQYPFINQKVAINEVPKVIKAYLDRIFLGQYDGFQVQYQQFKLFNGYEIATNFGKVRVNMENFLSTYGGMWEGQVLFDPSKTRIPDSIIVTRQTFINLDNVVNQIVADLNMNIVIEHIFPIQFLWDEYSMLNNIEIADAHPEWDIFKFHEGFMLVDLMNEEFNELAFPAFVPLQNYYNSDLLVKFEYPYDGFHRYEVMSNEAKKELLSLLQKEYSKKTISNEVIEKLKFNVVYKSSICDLVPELCYNFNYESEFNLDPTNLYPMKLKDAMPELSTFLEDKFDAIIHSFDLENQIMEIKHSGSEIIFKIGDRNGLFLDFLELVNTQLRPKNRQLIFLPGGNFGIQLFMTTPDFISKFNDFFEFYQE